MELEYEKIQENLKQEARSASGGIGFIAPGMLTPRGRRPEARARSRAASASISAAVARKGSAQPGHVERDSDRRPGDEGDAVHRGDLAGHLVLLVRADAERGAAGEAGAEQAEAQ